MNTIRNYLENMFLGMSQTDDVKHAKEELFAMMEDKYQELKNDGKTESEAIGIVISEFGNLEELAEALGIKGVVEQKNEVPCLSYERANDYLEDSRKIAPKTALAVWLCIMSPVILLSLLGLHESRFISVKEDYVIAIGLVFVIILVATAVSLFIRYTGKLGEYQDLQETVFRLDYKTEQMVNNIYVKEKQLSNSAVSTSVIGYIISGLPLIVLPLLFEDGGIHLLGVVLTLILVASSTYRIINKSGVYDACKALLQLEDYEIQKKSNKTYKVFSQVYWMIVVALYLGYSFITNDWRISWVIWPVAGIIFGAVKVIILR